MPDEENIESVESAESVVEKSDFSENQEEPSEQSLEDIAEQPQIRDADLFSESSMEVHDMPNPTIQASESISGFQDNLEQSASEGIADSGSSQTTQPAQQFGEQKQEQEKYVDNVLNLPDYTSREEATAFRQMRERGMSARNVEDLRQTQRTVMFETPSQLRESGGFSEERDYAVMELGKKEDDTPRSPLERKRDYRPLKR